MGYDIADYTNIDPVYGTNEDVDELIAELGKRDMKLMMDLVVNHTSNEHPWFLESRSSKDNPRRDWYLWKDPKSRSEQGTPEPPNNWAQILGEANSAWNYDTNTGQYYMAIFTPEQPDLNWENPEVRAAVWDVMKYWLDKGVGGFRMDVINMISKVPGYPDAEIILDPKSHKFQPGTKYFVNGPKLHDYIREMYDEVLTKYDNITVGEMPGVDSEDEILRTVGADARELNMIFIFALVDVDKPNVRMALKDWDVHDIKRIVSRWQKVMIEKNGWNSVFIENHDNPRSVTRYTDDSDQYRFLGAKLLALMQTTLGGTLFVYQGEEIGLRNFDADVDPYEFKDIETINYWKKTQALYGDGINPEKYAEGKKIIQMKARDHARSPMQWSDEPNAGFCDEDVKPWMRLMDDYKTVNAKTQMEYTSVVDMSVWQWWQFCINSRKTHADIFVYGDYEEVNQPDDKIFGYVRTSFENGKKALVVLNFSGEERTWKLPAQAKKIDMWVCSNYQKGPPRDVPTE
ncbi:hypothetical protein LTR66_015456, partial [Elasticomyces elasticus]